MYANDGGFSPLLYVYTCLRLPVVEIDEKIKFVCINLCFDNRYFKTEKLYASAHNVSAFVFEFVFRFISVCRFNCFLIMNQTSAKRHHNMFTKFKQSISVSNSLNPFEVHSFLQKSERKMS